MRCENMNKINIFLLSIALLGIIGTSCAQQQTKYVCPDGTSVSNPSLCPKEDKKIVFCLDKTKFVCFGRDLNKICASTNNYGCCPSEIQYPNEALCNVAKDELLRKNDTERVGKCIIENYPGPPTMIDEECKLDSDCYKFASAMNVKDTNKVKCLK